MTRFIAAMFVAALLNPAHAGTAFTDGSFEDYRATLERGLMHACLRGDYGPLSTNSCACWVGRIIEPMTVIEAVTMHEANAVPDSIKARMVSGLRACQ